MTQHNESEWLFVILAYQNGLINKDAVISALTNLFQKSTDSVSQWLVENQHLTRADADLVARLVELHVQRNAGDANKTLLSLNAKQFATSLAQDTPQKDLFATLATALPTPRVREGNLGLRKAFSKGETRYEIVRPHAEGGLGVVYAANDRELNRLIALKQIKAGTPVDELSIQRFVSEAEITGGLEHPGIVPVYSFGVDENDRPFYAMRLIQGESLKVSIEKYHSGNVAAQSITLERDVRFRQLLDRFISVCNTIAYAHNRGVIHRDIKPANIMLGPFGETLVVDWGLAKALESEPNAAETLPPNAEHLGKLLSGSSVSATLPGSPIGTPAYMSPEQASGDLSKIGPASDIYGLGATLYSILTGKPPLDCRSVEEAIQKVLAGDIRPVRKINPVIAPALAAICHKALSLNPSDRYESPLQLAADVQRWLADEPVTAHRDTFPTRCWRTIRKHRTMSSVIASIGVVCLTGAMIISTLLAQKNEQLAASNAEAVARLDQAMNSYDGYVSGLYEELQSGTDFTPDQVEFLLEKPREFYEKLTNEIAAKAEPLEREQAWLAIARYNLALVNEMLGRPRDALSQYELSLSTYKRLLERYPDRVGYLRGLSSCYNNLAVLHDQLGQPAEALSIFDALQEVHQKLKKIEPGQAEHSIAAFDTLNNKSKALEASGRLREAIDVLQVAIKNLRESHADETPDSQILYRLAIGHMNLGTYRSSLGELAQTQSDFEISIKAWKQLNDLTPNSPALIDGLAATQLGLARLQILTDDHESAITTLRGAEEQYRKLAKNQNAVPQFRQRLATTLGLLSNAARNAGDLELAEQSAAESVDVTKKLLESQPDVPEVMSELGQAYHALGMIHVAKKDDVQAETTFSQGSVIRKRLAEKYPSVATFPYELGATLINLANSQARQGNFSEAKKTYQQAIAASEKAVKLGSDAEEYKRVLAIAWYELSQSHLATEDFANCIEATEAYLPLVGADAEWLESAASAYASCARRTSDDELRERWRKRGLELLAQLQQAVGPESLTESDDEDLTWLRSQ